MLRVAHTDGHALYPKPQDGRHNAYFAATEPNAIPELYDIPLSLVNRVLYRHDELAASKQGYPAPEPRDPQTHSNPNTLP